jgi:hypothetical protein
VSLVAVFKIVVSSASIYGGGHLHNPDAVTGITTSLVTNSSCDFACPTPLVLHALNTNALPTASASRPATNAAFTKRLPSVPHIVLPSRHGNG